jgi:CRP/FNR family transcriptional regulator
MSQSAASFEIPCQKCQVRNRAICAALEDDQLRDLNAISTQVTLEAGRMIFMEGDEASFLFNIISGHVRVSKSLPDGRRQITGFLFPGDFLGLSIGGAYAYSADSISDVHICRFPRKGIEKITLKFPNFEHRLLQLASHELGAAQNHVLLLGRKTAAEKICSFLIFLAERNGDTAATRVALPMTRADIADYLGLTVETVSRAIGSLKKRGAIQLIEPTLIDLCDKAQLRLIAEGDA